MNFRINSGIIVFSIFSIAFHPPIQFIQAHLANEDLLDAISCTRKFFGDIIETPFLEKNDALSDGEYFGGFCEGLSSQSIDEKVQQDTDGTQIKNCLLEDKKNKKVFDKYAKKSRLLTKKPGSFSLRNFSIKRSTSSSTSAYMNEETPTPTTLPIMQFLLGACKDEEIKEFEQLTKEEDKQQTEECLLSCADKFISRIGQKLAIIKINIIQLLEEKIEELENNKVPYVSLVSGSTNILRRSDSLLQEKYRRFIKLLEDNEYVSSGVEPFASTMKKNQSTLIVHQNEIGKLYLEKYAKFYAQKDSCLPDDLGEIVPPFLEDLDYNLFKIFSTYKNCSKLGCGMGTTTTPLYGYIEKEANKTVPQDTDLETDKGASTDKPAEGSSKDQTAKAEDFSKDQPDEITEQPVPKRPTDNNKLFRVLWGMVQNNDHSNQ